MIFWTIFLTLLMFANSSLGQCSSRKLGKKKGFLYNLLPLFVKNRCITQNCIYSFSNLRNGMCHIIFLSTLDIFGVENSLIKYL